MGVFEEAKIRLNDIQSRINRIRLAGEELSKNQNDQTVKTKFRVMYTTVSRLQEEFESQISVVIKQLGKPEQKSEDSQPSPADIRERFDEAFFTIMMFAEEFLPAVLRHVNADDTFIELNNTRQSANTIPLEKLSIPRFKGDPKEYTGFRNLFDTVVHDNLNLRPVVKFSYLKAYLEGEPLKLVTNLMLSDDNYNLALKILDTRYSNRRIIVQSHLDQLWDMPKAVFGDAKSIRQLLNTITESIGALKNQNYMVDQWDPILLHLFQKKVDSQLRAQWELLVDTSDDPSVEDFMTFLTKFGNAASAGQPGSGREKILNKPQSKMNAFHSTQSNQNFTTPSRKDCSENKRQFTCQVCKAKPGHLLIACTVFKDKSPKERYQIIRDLKRCFLCFSEHMVTQCKHNKLCSECGGRHHTLLHFNTSNSDVEPPAVNALLSSADNHPYRPKVLLSTLSVLVQDLSGHFQEARALLDSGSQCSFMTENCRLRLGLPRQKCCVGVQAMAGMQVPSIKAHTEILLKPIRQDTPQLTVDVFVLPRITGLIPSERVKKTEWAHVKGLELADPRYNESLPIDILLGADVYPYVIGTQKREGTLQEPVAFETVFGWALMGRSIDQPTTTTTTLFSSMESVDMTLRRFWEIEELPTASIISPDEKKCEEIYHTTTTRQQDGRYIVNLPFTQDPPLLGESKSLAMKRLIQLESRLSKSAELRKDYNDAMQNYLDAGHMVQVESNDIKYNLSYYIPHHAVIKPGSNTTRVRVVFDASAVTTNGKSLNDYLYAGPKLQQDLSGIIIRFRLHTIVFTADIKQMFRQIVVAPKYRPYQRLLFRFSPTDPVKTFEMSTVTFGQRSSPFLAIKTLHQLANDECENYPEVRRTIQRDLYVDDVATGAECEETALQLQMNLITVFNRGKFELRKWSSNSEALLENIPPDHRQTDSVTFDDPGSDYTKVLGLKWEPKPDTLAYQYLPNAVCFTKRAILSEIARIYDPIGFLTPLTANLKRIMKYLWSIGLGWDDKIPEDAAIAWSRYHTELPLIGSIRMPRQVTTNRATYELHGFCDSSEIAYSAAVYLLSRDPNETTRCYLLMGRSKIAPEKKLSIPRLELCGAFLLARTIKYLQNNLTTLPIENIYAWSDSTVVLTWIQMPTARLKTFVANRIAQIQHMTSPDIWRHVPTTQNPVDCATRGLTPRELVDHPIWWSGPSFLYDPVSTWPPPFVSDDTYLEMHRSEEKPVALLNVRTEEECKLLFASADLSKVLRLTAYWLRLRRVFLHKPQIYDLTSRPGVSEKEDALLDLLRWIQQIHFQDDLIRLNSHKPCSLRLRYLGAFIDYELHLIRVGGRLVKSDIPYAARHPILLPKKSQLTILLINHVHRQNCHPGPQTTQNLLHQKYWILSARNIIRKTLHQCIPCFQAKPKPMKPSMGNLPRPRLVSTKAFTQVGVDFAGPFMVKAALLRRIQTTKGYLCIFVCMATRAVHLELVSDLSTALFLAALTRFISRRGRCTDLYSDCGLNFVGAKNYLQEVKKFITSSELGDGIANNQIRWHLNPPAAPHMGGLWEAAVKSAKTLLHRTIQQQILTYEELNTIFHRIEAILNSRPLGALTADPNDFQPLTAGHFLTMEPLVTVPSPENSDDIPILGLRQRWTLVQRVQQHFWDRWQKEYLHTIQMRSKWHKDEPNLVPGDLVIVQEPTPPLSWKTARVTEVYPGDDNVVRVAAIRTADGKTFKRPAVKLCRLPIQF